jgi:hypothetical protein
MRKKERKFAEHGGQARVLAFVQLQMLAPLLWFLALMGSLGIYVLAPVQAWAHDKAAEPMGAVACIGVSPTGMNMGNLPQTQAIYHDKSFVENLKGNTCFLRMCSRRELPEQSGNQHRLYMYNTMTAQTTQQADGTVGASSIVSVVNNTSVIGQFADYINVSDISLQTAIDPALENLQRELGYRLGLSLSTLVRNTADGANLIDTKVDDLSKLANVPFGRNDIVTAVQSLAGVNAQPFANGTLTGAIHPFVVGDALNDATNNSITDQLKRTAEGAERLAELPSPDGDVVPVLDVAGVRFHQTTMVTQTANYLASGRTALRTYVVAKDGLICISLGKKEGAQIGDGDWRNLHLWMYKFDTPSRSDPSRVIGGFTSYNVKFVPTLPPDTTQRIRYIDSVSNVS